MGLIKTKGIVTKVINYSDNDKILTVITADQGKIQVFCKGAQKIKNSILASTEFLAFSEFVLYEGSNDMYKMSSAEVIEVFYNLRIDIEKLVYATTMSQIMNDVCLEEELCAKKLQLFLNALYILSETNKNLDFVYSVFCVRLLALLGYIPRLGACVVCGENATQIGEKSFSIKDNGIKCAVCSRVDKGSIRISEVTYTSLLYILSSDAKKIFSFEIPRNDLVELKLLSDLYLTEKLEKEYKIMRLD